ncbi:para-aminobenzoate synthase PabaA [Striga asiatica]|uniref:Para-aminobenzoate synthase PabaA n=1 Tax=Striga asiatica TaxID=4170 RepID=A0A5A7P7V4_STRAF|nr:para-aminobenzoate synthase PabaA [Striga asiatica]
MRCQSGGRAGTGHKLRVGALWVVEKGETKSTTYRKYIHQDIQTNLIKLQNQPINGDKHVPSHTGPERKIRIINLRDYKMNEIIFPLQNLLGQGTEAGFQHHTLSARIFLEILPPLLHRQTEEISTSTKNKMNYSYRTKIFISLNIT